MNTTLWTIQGILAGLFLMSGIMKLTLPKVKVVEKAGEWANDFSETKIKLIGMVEVLGALGLILPSYFKIMPNLTPAAAGGLGIIMIAAALNHSKRIENKNVLVNVILLILAVIVVLGRLIFSPIS